MFVSAVIPCPQPIMENLCSLYLLVAVSANVIMIFLPQSSASPLNNLIKMRILLDGYCCELSLWAPICMCWPCFTLNVQLGNSYWNVIGLLRHNLLVASPGSIDELYDLPVYYLHWLRDMGLCWPCEILLGNLEKKKIGVKKAIRIISIEIQYVTNYTLYPFVYPGYYTLFVRAFPPIVRL